MAPFQKHRDSLKYYLSLKLLHEISFVREEFGKRSQTYSAVSNIDVMRTYFEEERVSRTMTILAHTAFRFPRETLDTLDGFQPIHHNDVTKQYQPFVYDLDEESKFLWYMPGNNYSITMEITRTNFL